MLAMKISCILCMKIVHLVNYVHSPWKSCSLKSHYLTTKTQKTTHIQLLCNYPLGITTSVQLSPYKYGVLINKLSCQKMN